MKGATVTRRTIGCDATINYRPPGRSFAVMLRGFGLTEDAAFANLREQMRRYGQSSGVDLRDSLPPDLRD